MFQADEIDLVVDHRDIAVKGHRQARRIAETSILVSTARTFFEVSDRLRNASATASTGHSHRFRHTRHGARFDLRAHANHVAALDLALFDFEATVHQRREHECLQILVSIDLQDFVGDFLRLRRVT